MYSDVDAAWTPAWTSSCLSYGRIKLTGPGPRRGPPPDLHHGSALLGPRRGRIPRASDGAVFCSRSASEAFKSGRRPTLIPPEPKTALVSNSAVKQATRCRGEKSASNRYLGQEQCLTPWSELTWPEIPPKSFMIAPKGLNIYNFLFYKKFHVSSVLRIQVQNTPGNSSSAEMHEQTQINVPEESFSFKG